jgi:hypothetical protein
MTTHPRPSLPRIRAALDSPQASPERDSRLRSSGPAEGSRQHDCAPIHVPPPRSGQPSREVHSKESPPDRAQTWRDPSRAQRRKERAVWCPGYQRRRPTYGSFPRLAAGGRSLCLRRHVMNCAWSFPGSNRCFRLAKQCRGHRRAATNDGSRLPRPHGHSGRGDRGRASCGGRSRPSGASTGHGAELELPHAPSGLTRTRES